MKLLLFNVIVTSFAFIVGRYVFKLG